MSPSISMQWWFLVQMARSWASVHFTRYHGWHPENVKEQFKFLLNSLKMLHKRYYNSNPWKLYKSSFPFLVHCLWSVTNSCCIPPNPDSFQSHSSLAPLWCLSLNILDFLFSLKRILVFSNIKISRFFFLFFNPPFTITSFHTFKGPRFWACQPQTPWEAVRRYKPEEFAWWIFIFVDLCDKNLSAAFDFSPTPFFQCPLTLADLRLH